MNCTANSPGTNYENEEYLLAMGLLYKDKNPFMVNTEHVNKIILEGLQEMHEQWVSKALKPIVAFGLRVYQNQSQLLMHLENPTTHVDHPFCTLHDPRTLKTGHLSFRIMRGTLSKFI
jgi:hypothetical protein